MLGLGDLSILMAMVGCVAATLVCVIYGAINWNRGAETADDNAVSRQQGEEKQ